MKTYAKQLAAIRFVIKEHKTQQRLNILEFLQITAELKIVEC